MSYARGVGAYPTDSYYDPNRPSWMPYWMNDLTESNAEYNNAPFASQVVQAAESMGGAVGGVIGGTAGSVVGGAVSAAVPAATGLPDWTTPLLIGGIALVGMMVVLPMLMGRR
jgi:hypothetical protein